MRYYDVVVVGGGAAGVMAAGVAAAGGRSVLLCERMEKPQRKVRITGKGRCNLTNRRSEAEFLAHVRAGADLFAPAFRSFTNEQTVAFFEQIGVPLTTERGERVFPASGRAWDVADAHIRWAAAQGAEIRCHCRVIAIKSSGGAVRSVLLEERGGMRDEVACRAVIVATGGASYPSTGSSGDGYTLAYKQGHRIESIRPSLTPLETAADVRSLQGLSLRNVAARLLIDGEERACEFGELQFFKAGIEGPLVLRFSRQAVDALIDGRSVEVIIDLKPALDRQTLLARFGREIEALGPAATLRTLGGKLLPSALVAMVLREAGLEPNASLESFGPSGQDALIGALKNFRLRIKDYRPFEEAVVTAGGVDVREVDPLTLQSRLVRGLYFAGEVLDIDADTGGYNLQVAYSTGHLAGELNE